MKIVYCAQFRDQTGYGVAARRYLKALDVFLNKNSDSFDLKAYSVVASESDKIDQEELSLLKKYEFKCVNSTNDTAIKLIQKGNEKGIIFSDNQKKGKGRYGKKWISIKGNLFVSIFFSN